MGFGSGLINAAIGLGEGAKFAAPFVKQQKEAEQQAAHDERIARIQAARDATLARLQEEAAMRGEERKIANIPRTQAAELPGAMERKRQEADIEISTANRKPQTVAEGATLLREGQEPFTAPRTAIPKAPEELAEIGARTGLLKAQEEYWRGAKTNESEARAEARRAGKEPKPIFPKLTKGDQEGTFWIDQNTNAIGTIVPATPDIKGEKNWIFPDKPEVKGKPAHMVWNFGGRTMSDIEYNRTFYGSVNPVSGGMGEAASTDTNDPLGLRSVLPKERPPLGTFDLSKRQATQPAKSATPGATSGLINDRISPADSRAPVKRSPDAEIAGGPEVDAARLKVAQTWSKLQSFGLAKRRQDPAGFAAAQREYAKAKQDEEAALVPYQRAVNASTLPAMPLRQK